MIGLYLPPGERSNKVVLPPGRRRNIVHLSPWGGTTKTLLFPRVGGHTNTPLPPGETRKPTYSSPVGGTHEHSIAPWGESQ